LSYPKVTVVGAGQVGATTALCLLTRAVSDVVLVDVAEGTAQGKALDLMHARSVLRFAPIVSGSNDYADTAGSDLVVVTAGIPRRPGMTRDELLAVNAGIVESVVTRAVSASPGAVVICVTNPLDVMTHLAWKLSGLPAERVFGMGGVLDSARFAYFIAQATGAPIDRIDALVVGAHGDAMVPVPRLSTVAGRPLTDVLPPGDVAEVVRRTVFGGAEVVSLLGTGSAFYAPGASVAAMVEAVLADSGAVMPTCVLLQGEYGISGVHMSVPAVLGRRGVADVPEFEFDDAELSALRASADQICEQVAALESARS
jgi:malate dehydrogenase